MSGQEGQQRDRSRSPTPQRNNNVNNQNQANNDGAEEVRATADRRRLLEAQPGPGAADNRPHGTLAFQASVGSVTSAVNGLVTDAMRGWTNLSRQFVSGTVTNGHPTGYYSGYSGYGNYNSLNNSFSNFSNGLNGYRGAHNNCTVVIDGNTVFTSSNGYHGNRSSSDFTRTQVNNTVTERANWPGGPTFITTSDSKLDLSDLDADSDIEITALMDVEISGHRGRGGLNIGAEGQVTLVGGSNSIGPVSITANGSVAVNWLRISGPMSVSSDGSVTATDARTSGPISLTAGRNVTLDRLRASGPLSVTAGERVTVADTHTNGPVVVTADGDVDLGGLRGNGPLSVTSAGTVSNNRRRTGPTCITDRHSGGYFSW